MSGCSFRIILVNPAKSALDAGLVVPDYPKPYIDLYKDGEFIGKAGR